MCIMLGFDFGLCLGFDEDIKLNKGGSWYPRCQALSGGDRDAQAWSHIGCGKRFELAIRLYDSYFGLRLDPLSLWIRYPIGSDRDTFI